MFKAIIFKFHTVMFIVALALLVPGFSVMQESKLASLTDSTPTLWKEVMVKGKRPFPISNLMLAEARKIVAGDGAAGDFFGEHIAISGDTAVVGSIDVTNVERGAAYVFERNEGGADNWGLVKKLTGSDIAIGERFGNAVDISQDTIIVGVSAQNGSRGAVYVFERDQGGADNWGETKKIISSDGMASLLFGRGVAISQDTIISGAAGNGNIGQAHIFDRNNGGANNWGETKKLTPSDTTMNQGFGQRVAISNDTVIVGAPNNDSAYIFDRNNGGANNWGETKKLTASDSPSSELFARSISISSDTVVIGDSLINSQQGAAYIFGRNQGGANNWGEVKKLTASDAMAGDNFGIASSINGNTVLIAADKKNSQQGAVYVLGRDQGGANNWGEVETLTASDGAMNDQFGNAVSLSNDTAIIGAPFDDVGSAYIFTVSSSSPSINCPANIVANTDIDQCLASVMFTVTAGGSPSPMVECSIGGMVITSPHSFPVGATAVDCTASNGNAPDASCGFTVTVNDTQTPTIVCPPNQVVNNDANQCGAVVNYPAPSASDNCPLPINSAMCAPPAGAFFPTGATTVACTVTDSAGLMANCSFTVTVNDVQGPIIMCPGNTIALTQANTGCSAAPGCGVVNYAMPMASDCSMGQVTVNCAPPTGTCFALGTTTVTCTATDAMNNNSACSFTVTVFDIVLQDDSNPAIGVVANSATGEYRICCAGTVYAGTATVRKKGCDITLEDGSTNRRFKATVNRATFKGTASLQSPPGATKCTITDRDTRNDTLICGGN